MKNCIYRFLNKDNEVIYIGRAKDLKSRLSGHRHLPLDCYKCIYQVQYITFEDENTLDFVECYFIQKYKPIYNSKFNNGEKVFRIEELDKKRWKFYKGFAKHINISTLENIKATEDAESVSRRKLVDIASSNFII